MTTGKYDELIMSFLRGDCSEEEARFISVSVAESSDNQAYFDAIKRVWELTDFPQLKVDVEAALQLVNEQIDSMEQNVSQPIRVSWFRRNVKRVSAVAAVLVMAVTVGLLLRKPAAPPMLSLSSSDWKSDQPFVLPDGSSVMFEGDSKVTYPETFDGESRAIAFDGVAVFDIIKNPAKPFVIQCGSMDVEVLGTRFRLDATKGNDKYVLDLFEGHVVMTANNTGKSSDMIRVMPGERGVCFVNTNGLKRYTALDLMKEKALNDHVLDFNDADLKTIVNSIAFIYDIQIDLAERCQDYRLTARFSDETVQHVLETIAAVYNLELVALDSTHFAIR